MIVCDEHNERAQELWAALQPHLPPGWAPPRDMAVVVGGDGFLLRTVARHGFDLAYLGLNAGHLGFLLNDVPRPADAAAALVSGRYRAHGFPLLEAEVTHASGETSRVQAINDIYLERMTGQSARLALSLGGHLALDELVADGMIFASALGSTAYSYSAGGLPLHPTIEALQVTPICPHVPRLSSFVLPRSAQARVDVHQAQWRPVRVVADGRGLDDVIRVDVGLSDQAVHLCYFDSHDFTRQMLHKIIRA